LHALNSKINILSKLPLMLNKNAKKYQH